MLFNSVEFIFLFLPATLAVYFLLCRMRLTLAAKSSLVFASLFFYSWWNIRYLPLILGSLLFNFAAGAYISRTRRKTMLVLAISANAALLGYYKYADFFIASLNNAAGVNMGLMNIVLPLGISFFTFTQIAYLVDCHRGEVKEHNLLNYSLFVTFFPHLLAGPIIHHKEMMPQFDRVWNKTLRSRNLATGMYLFFLGLSKKVIIADRFAEWANMGFTADSLSFAEAWITSLSYTFQLYFDFSGYTDMAIGAALMFNITLPENFKSPYKALDIQDFWRRWHITLSRFLRDYVYIPLGGSRTAGPLVFLNLIVTFLIGGLWHGAGWTFVFWGFLHGLAMCALRLWRKTGIALPGAVAWFLTFNFVNLTWVFFRAKDWQEAFKVLRGMAGMSGFGLPLPDPGTTAVMAVTCAVAALAALMGRKAAAFRPDWKSTVFVIVTAFYTLFNFNRISEFLYFNF